MISFTAEQCILVTGASSGIGEAIALQCNALGAAVIACGRNLERLEANKERSACPKRFHIEQRDLVEDMGALPTWVKSLREKYGKLSGLVPCAGYATLIPLREHTHEAACKMLDIHYHVPLLLAKGFADRRNNVGVGSSIVFISSASALIGCSAAAVYGGAKGALAVAAAALSKELAPQKIRVNAVASALVNTPMGKSYLSFLPPDALESELKSYPLGLGQPTDVAGMVAFLLADTGRWITGQHILMDGGRY